MADCPSLETTEELLDRAMDRISTAAEGTSDITRTGLAVKLKELS
jgi:hypothetical protein